MPLPQLNIYRHDSRQRSLVTLVGTGFLRLEPSFGHRPPAVTPASVPTGCRVTLRRLATEVSAVAGGAP